MKRNFQISCESTVDLPYEYVASRGMPVMFYAYTVDMDTFEDDMGRDPEALPRFYRFLDDGKLPSTSQLTEYQYESVTALTKSVIATISKTTGTIINNTVTTISI